MSFGLDVRAVGDDGRQVNSSALDERGTMEIRNAVAIVIHDETGAFLSVRRPADDPHLADVWGLPAVNLRAGERPEEAAVRVGREKLGVAVAVRRQVGCETVARPDFAVHLTEFEVDVVEGTPQVPQSDPTITQYVGARFTDDVNSLIAAARRGSACCRIFLRDRGVLWQRGSGLV
jgi:8-oxo-dGTP diphosphatase